MNENVQKSLPQLLMYVFASIPPLRDLADTTVFSLPRIEGTRTRAAAGESGSRITSTRLLASSTSLRWQTSQGQYKRPFALLSQTRQKVLSRERSSITAPGLPLRSSCMKLSRSSV